MFDVIHPLFGNFIDELDSGVIRITKPQPVLIFYVPRYIYATLITAERNEYFEPKVADRQSYCTVQSHPYSIHRKQANPFKTKIMP